MSLRSLMSLLIVALATLGIAACSGSETKDTPSTKDTAPVKDSAKTATDGPKSATPPTEATTPAATLQRDMKKLTAILQAGDMKAFVAMMPPDIANKNDTAAEMAAKLAANKDVLAILKSIEFGEPGQIASANKEHATILPTQSDIYQNGKLIGKMKGGLLAISLDDGASWQFTDIGSDGTRSQFKAWKPTLFEQIQSQFPNVSIEPIE